MGIGLRWPMLRRLGIMPAEAAPACLTAFQGVSPRVMRRFQRKPGSYPRLFLFSPLHFLSSPSFAVATVVAIKCKTQDRADACQERAGTRETRQKIHCDVPSVSGWSITRRGGEHCRAQILAAETGIVRLPVCRSGASRGICGQLLHVSSARIRCQQLSGQRRLHRMWPYWSALRRFSIELRG